MYTHVSWLFANIGILFRVESLICSFPMGSNPRFRDLVSHSRCVYPMTHDWVWNPPGNVATLRGQVLGRCGPSGRRHGGQGQSAGGGADHRLVRRNQSRQRHPVALPLEEPSGSMGYMGWDPWDVDGPEEIEDPMWLFVSRATPQETHDS